MTSTQTTPLLTSKYACLKTSTINQTRYRRQLKGSRHFSEMHITTAKGLS